MADDIKKNLQYFEAPSMHELYDHMCAWQDQNRKRLLSVCIERDSNRFCCIALTNPSEVVITSADGNRYARVDGDGHLHVCTH